jgi:Holliday junction resolvase RusA-like endonuclease
MLNIRFEIPGKPRGKGRPRFGRARVYTDDKTAQYERAIRYGFMEAAPGLQHGTKHHGAVRVSILAEFAPPRGGKAAKATIVGSEPMPYLHAPDADNIAKAVLDGLNGAAFADDRQVYRVDVCKFYGEADRIVVDVVYS